ncbi:MAG: fatty acid desaturase [Dehalococcoidia bacterium]
MQVLNALSVAEGTRAYSRLRSDITEAGILEKSYLYYLWTIAFAFGGYFASAAAIYFFDSYLLLVPACLGFTFFSVQIAGVNHDAGHRAIFKSVHRNNLMGVFSSFCLGIVFENWRVRHNMHHARPNQPSDPDLYVPFLVTDPNQLSSKTGLESKLLKYQALYYYPLGMLVSFSNRLGTISYFRHRPLNREDLWRLPLYATGIFFLFVAPFLFFDPAKALFVFFLVHLTSGVYLASCFAPNHKGMTILEDDARISFLEQQVVTGRSVTGGRLTEVMLVGLNHQTEHHLFPQTPRWKLRRITPHLQLVCDEHDIHFERATFVKTNRDILGVLRSVAREATDRSLAVEAAQAQLTASKRD